MGDAKSFLDLTMADLKTSKDFVDKPDPDPAETPDAKVTGSPDAKLVFESPLSVGATNEVIDIPYREDLQDFERRGVDFEVFLERYEEANAIFDLDSELDDRPFASAAERNQAALQLLASVDAILANPARAQQELEDFFARDPNADPVMKAYLAGDDDVAEMVTKLQQSAAGLPVVGRHQKKTGDGFVR